MHLSSYHSQPVRKKISNRTQILQQNSREILLIRMIRERISCRSPDRSTVAAFPGAEGAGKLTSGGAGGTVYTVTSLKDDGSEGTLRWAIEKSGKRTIVFAVGGVIPLSKQLQIKN